MEIGLGHGYPGSALSNLRRRRFIFRQIPCESIEGVLQAVKKSDPNVQRNVCLMWGMMAKKAGGDAWQRSQTLWWMGTPMARDSDEYKHFLDELYNEMFRQCADARKALLDTQGATLKHSIGKTKISETVLTQAEFVRRLNNVRQRLIIEESRSQPSGGGQHSKKQKKGRHRR